MSWGIYIKDVYVPRITKDGIDSAIEDQLEIVDMHEKNLHIFAAATPRDFEDEKWEEYSYRSIQEILREYRDAIYKLRILTIAKESEIEEG